MRYTPSAGGAEWADGAGDLTAWQAASPFDDNSLTSDAGYASPTGTPPDLSAASQSSAMVDAGHPSQSTAVDITGQARDGQPDIGAYER